VTLEKLEACILARMLSWKSRIDLVEVEERELFWGLLVFGSDLEDMDSRIK
jgi:hypothetical protein